MHDGALQPGDCGSEPAVEKTDFRHLRALATHDRDGDSGGDHAGGTAREYGLRVVGGFVLNSWEGALLRSQVEESDAPLEVFMQIAFDQLLKKHAHA